MFFLFELLIGYSIFLQLTSNPLSNASLTVDGKSAILDKGLLYMSCYGLIGSSFLIFVCLCQYFVIWFESCFYKKMSFSIRLGCFKSYDFNLFKVDDDFFKLLSNLPRSVANPSLLNGLFPTHKSDLSG